MKIAEKVITEVKFELVCDTDERTVVAARIIQEEGDTGHPAAGWVYISEIRRALPIGHERS